MEDWAVELQQGRPEAAWDLFLDRYRRLIFAAIRHYAQDYDDVMDVFARACEALRADGLRKLRVYVQQPDTRPGSPPGSSPSSGTSPSIGSATATAGRASPRSRRACRRCDDASSSTFSSTSAATSKRTS